MIKTLLRHESRRGELDVMMKLGQRGSEQWRSSELRVVTASTLGRDGAVW
jgi:hypothetical protein